MEIGSEEWENLVIDAAQVLGIHVDRKIARQFGIHGSELVKWTKKINLTTITDPFEVGLKHFVDSIVPARFISSAASVVDIGSGGGFPGIPLKILMPTLSITLIDGSRKKVNFLKHVIRTLRLENIDARQIRAEQLSKEPAFAHAFDVVISRALSALDPFFRMAWPLLAEEGVMIALKGKVNQKELEALRSAVFKKMDITSTHANRFSLTVEPYVLPFVRLKRSIITLSMFAKLLT